MNSPLTYLTLTRLKNWLKSMLHSPAKLIYGVILLALLGFVAFSGSLSEAASMEYRSMSELAALVLVFYIVMFLMIFSSGSSENQSMFSLSDVSLIFPAPIRPTRVLFYGLLRQLGLSMLLGFFLLFQYSWMHQVYGITYPQLILIVLGYALVLFFAQLAIMAVYVRTSGKDNAARGVKLGIAAVVLLYILWVVLSCREEVSLALAGQYGPLLASGTEFLTTLPGVLFPIAGWVTGIITGILTGNFLMILLCAGLCVVSFVLLLVSITTCKNNYYEDALSAAEVAHSAITAQKEGAVGEVIPKNVKLGKTGLAKGDGASAIYYKHKVENRRSSTFFLSNTALIFDVIIIVFAIFMRDGGIMPVLFMGIYMQLFSVALGRFNRELTKPYLYLMPEPPLKKMLYALKESLVSDSMESIVLMVIVGLIVQASPLDVVGCILARISFSLLFTAGNVLVERVFGTIFSKAAVMLLYFFILLLMSLPAIIVSILLFALLPAGIAFLSYIGLFILNVLVSFVVLYACRNILQYTDFTGK